MVGVSGKREPRQYTFPLSNTSVRGSDLRGPSRGGHVLLGNVSVQRAVAAARRSARTKITQDRVPLGPRLSFAKTVSGLTVAYSNETLQRKVRPGPLALPGHLSSSLADRLNTIEGVLACERLKISAPRYAQLGNVDKAGVRFQSGTRRPMHAATIEYSPRHPSSAMPFHSTRTRRCHRSRWQRCARSCESHDSTLTVRFPCFLPVVPTAP